MSRQLSPSSWCLRGVSEDLRARFALSSCSEAGSGSRWATVEEIDALERRGDRLPEGFDALRAVAPDRSDRADAPPPTYITTRKGSSGGRLCVRRALITASFFPGPEPPFRNLPTSCRQFGSVRVTLSMGSPPKKTFVRASRTRHHG